jgi:hypothetical protein
VKRDEQAKTEPEARRLLTAAESHAASGKKEATNLLEIRGLAEILKVLL